MKNLANCTPEEFLKQSNRIKKSLDKWIKDTNIREIRKRVPELEQVPPTATLEEKHKILDENKQRLRDQAMTNLSDILDAAIEKNPKETLNILALLCFVEPEEVNKHPIGEYFKALTELINDESVLGFFSSFLRLGQMLSANV